MFTSSWKQYSSKSRVLHNFIPSQFPSVWIIKLPRDCIDMEEKLPISNLLILVVLSVFQDCLG